MHSFRRHCRHLTGREHSLEFEVEKVKHIDTSGVYICTELDKLGVTIENFHKEMDEVFPKQEEAKVEEHDTQERLDLSLF